MSDRKSLYIVGNGPLPEDMSAEIDGADFVVRFNEPKASIGMSGTKTDLLFINNSGKPMQRRLNNPDYVRSPIVTAAQRVVFAYHPQVISKYLIKPNPLSWLKGRRADWTLKALDMFGKAGKEVLILPSTNYENGCAELGIPMDQMRKVFPSTGYFGIRYILQTHPSDAWDVTLCGFSWAGWKRHAWADERSWVEHKSDQGLIRVIT